MSQPDSADVDENDPEVQRNGFELYAKQYNVPDGVLEEFLEEEFVPSDPWEDNHVRWWHHFTQHVPRCPECQQKVTGAEPVGDGLDELRLEPCGDVVSPDVQA